MSKDNINSLNDLGPFLCQQNNVKNYFYISDIPKICKESPCMLGIDEAGRGPVIGPMVYGIAFCPLGKSDILKDLGCADSKQLTEEKREIIFDDINSKDYAKNNMGWSVEVISPSTISQKMLRRTKYSLNEISMDSAIGLINKAVEMGVNIAEVYVDTVGPPEKYEAKLSALFPDFLITVAKKADSTYPIVSAASICAKVTRDNALKVWKIPEGGGLETADIGSGYPGDPKTKAFLQDNIDMVFGYPQIVRFSWTTASNALQGHAYNVEFDEDEDTENQPQYGGAPITSFFKTKQTGKAKTRQRHPFFKLRFLDIVSDI